MADSTSIWRAMTPDPALPRVLARFGFAPSSLGSIAPLASGVGRHRGFRVRAGGQDWALKRHVSPVGVDRLEASHALELRLAEAGAPVATLRRAEGGETLVRDGPAWYSLHGWVVGQQVSIAERDVVIGEHPDLVVDLARLIATVHRVGGHEACGGDDVDPDRLLMGPRATLHEIRRPRRRIVSTWQALRLKPGKSEFDHWVLRVLPEVARRAEHLAGQSISDCVEGSDIGLIHGDVNWENLVFDEKFRVRALLDFDNAVRAPRVLEVGACAVVLVGADRNRVERFLAAYETALGVSLDRELVALAMELKCVRSILTSVRAHLGGGVDSASLMTWCRHLHESLEALPGR